MRNFIGIGTISIIILILFLLWILDFPVTFFIFLLFSSILFYFFRRIQPPFQEDQSLKEGIIFSPVNGKVISIKRDCVHQKFGDNLIEVRILVTWFKEFGTYFPSKCEVKDFHLSEGKSVFRFVKNIPDQSENLLGGLCITLTDSQSGDDYGIQFIKCPLGFWPRVKILPGDRGKAQVNFGIFPFGGLLNLYLPEKYEILVREELNVIAGETIISRIADASK